MTPEQSTGPDRRTDTRGVPPGVGPSHPAACRAGWFRILLALGGVGAAINGGVFFAFSTLTMPGLDRLAITDPRAAIGVMQEINVVAVRPPLMIVLFGTSAVSVGLAVIGMRRRRTRSGRLALAGAATFLFGVTGLTIAFHVPLNDALAAVGAGDDPMRSWAAYSSRWSVGNHVRAGTGIVAAALLTAAARDA